MRIAVLSDIHANLVALDAVLGHAGDVDAVWHCGDVVGYGPDPDAVVRRLRELGAVGVCGNHDAAALGGDEARYFNPDARRAIEWTAKVIQPSTRAFLAGLPEVSVLEGVQLVHGSLREPTWEYVTDSEAAASTIEVMTGSLALHGHTHVPLAWRAEGRSVRLVRVQAGTALALDERRVLANPGSVGQPRDNNPEASYLVLDTDRAELTWHRVPYDIAAVQVAMRQLGLPERLAARLELGV